METIGRIGRENRPESSKKEDAFQKKITPDFSQTTLPQSDKTFAKTSRNIEPKKRLKKIASHKINHLIPD
jgi:hypothetical protein